MPDKPIWETVAKIGAGLPEKELKKIPVDLAMRYKTAHRLYGNCAYLLFDGNEWKIAVDCEPGDTT